MCLKKDKIDPWLMKLDVQQDEITMKELVEDEQTTNTS
jgi:hypothetical protein